MEVFGFGSKKSSLKSNGVKQQSKQDDSVYNVPETIQVPASSLYNEVDPEQYDQDSDMRRHEHYNKQRRRSRYKKEYREKIL